MLSDRPYMRESYGPRWSVTNILLAVNALCFVIQAVVGAYTTFPLERHFALSLYGLLHGRIYQLITFQFLHAGLWHLLGNLIAIFFFGRAMEQVLGGRGLLKLYLLSGTIGGLLQIALAFAFPRLFGGAVLGASAGAFGLIAAFATHAPEQRITMLLFFILPLTFPAKVLLMIEAAIAVFGILVPGGSIAHAAHLGGMLTGIAYIRFAHRFSMPSMRWRPFRQSRKPRPLVSKVFGRTPSQNADGDLPSEEYISKEVDPILDKISAQGIHSLTERERQILDAARKRMARR